MLDLIVEPAGSEVRKPAASDVARHEDLPAQKVHLLIGRNDRHAGVVRSEGSPQQQAERAHLDAEEGSGALSRGSTTSSAVR
jgi:hypothetical protein